MDTERLEKAMNEAEIKAGKIRRLLDAKTEVEAAIIDIKFLAVHAGAMIFTGRSGKIGEGGLLREVRINAVAGCVAIPDLLLDLAEKKLANLEEEADKLSA